MRTLLLATAAILASSRPFAESNGVFYQASEARVVCSPGNPNSAAPHEAATTDPDSIAQNLKLARCYDTAWRFADAQRILERLLQLVEAETLRAWRTARPPGAPVFAGTSGAPLPVVRKQGFTMFPQPAVGAGKTGEVAVEFRIDAQGNVQDAQVVDSDPLFDRNAIAAMKSFRFEPPKVNGLPHDVWLVSFARFGLPEELMPADWIDRARVYWSRGLHTHALGAVEAALKRTKLDRERLGDNAGWDEAKTPSNTAPPRPAGMEEPKKISHVRPLYPGVAQANMIQGVVMIRALIDRQGKVARAHVTKSIPMLDAAALDAVRKWEYTVTTVKGEPFVVEMTVTVTFLLY